MKQYKPKEFSEMLLNVSVKTLRRWDNQGALTAYRNPKEEDTIQKNSISE